MSTGEKPKRPFTIVDRHETSDGPQCTVIRDGEMIDVPPISEERYEMLRELLGQIANGEKE